jgi:hypothetical protein
VTVSADAPEPEPVESAAAPPVDAPQPAGELDPYDVEVAAALTRIDARYGEVAAAVRDRQWSKASSALEPLVESSASGQRLDLFLAGNALRAAVAVRTGDARRASQHHRAILDAWQDPDAAARRIKQESAGVPQEEFDQRLALCLDAVGAATYGTAEAERLGLERVKAPVYRGPRTLQGIRKYVEQQLGPWLQTKREALMRAITAYKLVTEIRPAPPPRWAIAAAERVGSMHTRFADDFENAVPAIEASPREIAVYEDVVAGATAPFRAQALSAYEWCVGYGEKFQIEDDHVRICRSHLPPKP